MKRLIAEIHKSSDGVLHSLGYCVDEHRELDTAVTHTLLELIRGSVPNDRALESLVTQAETGCYVSPNPSMPDWGVNDINIWLVPPMARPSQVCVTNENTEYSSDEEYGQPQRFTFKQFHAALKHWRESQALIAREGKDKLLGQRFEVEFPD